MEKSSTAFPATAQVHGNDPGALAIDVMRTEWMNTSPTIPVPHFQPDWSKVTFWLSGVLALWFGIAQADELSGKVVAVFDGDTLTMLVDQRQIKVRLNEIDAPEKSQPFGSRSKQSLSDLAFGKTARLVVHRKDRYGRTLGRLYVGANDVNAEQVRGGMAGV